MEKWVRRNLRATVGAGVAALCTASLANADGTIVVTPEVESDSAAVHGDNGALGGDRVFAPGVGPGLQNESYAAEALRLPVAAVSGSVPVDTGEALESAAGVADSLPLAPAGPTNFAAGVVGVLVPGGAGAATGVVDNLPGTATSTVSRPATAELNENTQAATETAELNSSEPVATTHAARGDEGTVVAPETESSSTSVTGGVSIGSGDPHSAPVFVPATDEDVSSPASVPR